MRLSLFCSVLALWPLSGCGFVGGISTEIDDDTDPSGLNATGGDQNAETGGASSGGADGSGGAPDGDGGTSSGGAPDGDGGTSSGGAPEGDGGMGGMGSGGAGPLCEHLGGDSDADGSCDATDTCVDVDGDGLGNGHLGNAGCDEATTDTDDNDNTSCSDLDADGCDDCSAGVFDPRSDGTDEDGDGVCAATDCDDEKSRCTSNCTDLDDDGYCADTDCAENLPTCTNNCGTHTDADGVEDCVEEYCGSDPLNSTSTCSVVSSEESLNAAIQASENSGVRDHILIGSITLTNGLSELKGDEGVIIRQLVGSVLEFNRPGGTTLLKISATNAVIDGLHIRNIVGAQTIFEVTADDNVITNVRIDGFLRQGIFIKGGDRIELTNNWIVGGLNAPGNDIAAFVIQDTADSTISGNVAAQNNGDGFQFRKADGLFFDHNTSADNAGAGAQFYAEASLNLCLRNNLMSGNDGAAIDLSKNGNTFNTTASCTGPLPSGAQYGNTSFDNAGGNCTNNCGELPSGLFWEYALNPFFVSTSRESATFYCLGASALVDAGHDIGWYDLNGDEPGNFNGSDPDVGARESGPGVGCP